jgi:peptidyl-prolyl cis-trans isomerase D
VLDFLRRNTQSLAVKIILGIISVVFIFFLGGGGQIGAGPRPVAYVGEGQVTPEDFDNALRRNERYYREQYGDQLTPQLLQALDLPSLTLNQLVDQSVLRQEAERLGLMVPDEAVLLELREIEAFHANGQFSPSAYRTMLTRQGLTPAAFEDSMREQMLIEQLVDVVRRGVHVSSDEAFEAFAREGEKLTLDYVKISAGDFTESVEVADDGLLEYYETNAETYRVPESVRVRYLEYAPADFAEVDEITEEQIEEYYVLNKETEFTNEESIGARHILKRVAPDADEEAKAEAKKAIEEAKARIQGGESFSDVAKEVSDDGSAESGGDLGTFGRGRMVKPFEEAAFALEIDEISDVVESQFGYHIIVVYEKTEAGEVSLEDAREDIALKLAEENAADALFDAASSDALDIQEGASIETIAEERGKKIIVSGPFGAGGSVDEIGPAPDLVAAALALDEVGDTADAQRVGANYYVFQLHERIDSKIPELENIHEPVVADYKRQLSSDAARDAGDELLAAAKESSLADAAEAAGYEVEQTDAFDRRGRFVPGIGAIPALKDVAFETSEDGELLPRTFVHREDAYVLARANLETADRAEFEEQEEEFIERLRRQKEQAAIQDFINTLKEQTEISYNQEILARIMQ